MSFTTHKGNVLYKNNTSHEPTSLACKEVLSLQKELNDKDRSPLPESTAIPVRKDSSPVAGRTVILPYEDSSP